MERQIKSFIPNRQELHKYYGGEVILSDYFCPTTLVDAGMRISLSNRFDKKCLNIISKRNEVLISEVE